MIHHHFKSSPAFLLTVAVLACYHANGAGNDRELQDAPKSGITKSPYCNALDENTPFCNLCEPFRSPDYCDPSESFPSLIQARTTKYRNSPSLVSADGYWFHALEDKIAGYLLTVDQALPAPEVYCCVTNVEHLAGCLEAKGLKEKGGGFTIDSASGKSGIVVKATHFHSNQGVFILVNETSYGAGEAHDLIRKTSMSYIDIEAALSQMQASKIIVEEFIGKSLPVEYKLHVVNGKVQAIDIIQNRGEECACYAVVDTNFNRLDNHGCFEPGGTEYKDPNNPSCTSIDFDTGATRAGPVKKDMYLCHEVVKPDLCVIEDMINVAEILGKKIGVAMRVDIFVVGQRVYVQEYSPNPMNGLRHCAARVNETTGCVDSCFLGREWKAAGGRAEYGGQITAVPDKLNDFLQISDEARCGLIDGVTPSTNGFVSQCMAPTPISTSEGVPLPVAGGATVVLRKSSIGELYTLTMTNSVPYGRSYDGHNWERLHPALLSYVCSDPSCSVDLPPGEYLLEAFRPETPSAEQQASRFLIQTTFGPTESDISSIISNETDRRILQAVFGNPAQWVKNQMDLPATLHRAHYRQRANARLTQGLNWFGTRDPCLPGSRWNRFAFSKEDTGSIITPVNTTEGKVALQIFGVTRTELDSFEPGIPAPYVICEVAEYVTGNVLIGTENSTAMKCDAKNAVTILNPEIAFHGESPAVDAVLEELTPSVLDVRIAVTFPSGCHSERGGPIFVREMSQSSYYIHDKRLMTIDNTPRSSIATRNVVTKTCPSAPKTFLNEDTCVVRPDCSPPTWSSKSILLDEHTLADFYTSSDLYVYRVSELRLLETQKSPCAGGTASYRWTRRNSRNDTSGCPDGESMLDAAIKSSLVRDISVALQPNLLALVLDVTHSLCSDPSKSAIGARVSVPGAGCWTHSHPDEWSVYDFSAWVVLHPGNPEAFDERGPNPIAKIAWQDQVTLNFPDWHPQSRWDGNKWRFTYVGRWYDTVDFARLHPKQQSPTMASLIGSSMIGWSEQYEVCGSPGEVANDPSKGHQYNNYRYANQASTTQEMLDQDHHFWFFKSMVWSTIALDSPDQLRQRVAWALSQIFVVSADGVNQNEMTEPWVAFYDIFVRHAFGNFADILKEVSYSPMMGIMLTYMDSKSFAYSVETSLSTAFPDENFAREIMQLFTIGLWKLKPDGTKLLDEMGNPIPTYDNSDITTLARGWTGLQHSRFRGNLEIEWNPDAYARNYIDPMRVFTKDTRDVFPKLGLDDNGRSYIGDGVQRCDQMPAKAFLKKGAIYRFLGHNSNSDLGRADPSWWVTAEGWNPRLVLSPSSSALYKVLCSADDNGECQFQSYVELDVNLPCDGRCNAGTAKPDSKTCECDIDEPRVVRLDASSATRTTRPVYYEYIRRPCVNMAFPEGPTFVVSEINPGGEALCVDAASVVASGACCDKLGIVTARCVFQGERVSFYTAEQRCLAAGQSICSWDSVPTSGQCGTDLTPWDLTDPKAGLQFTWTNEQCAVKVQIDAQGNVAIIHNVASKSVKGRVRVDTGTYFRVLWDGSYPLAVSKCGSEACQPVGNTCLCNTVSSLTAVFTDLPSAQKAVSNLRVGAPDPAMFDVGIYHRCMAPKCTENQDSIIAYTKGVEPVLDDGSILFDRTTIFQIVDPVSGKSRFLMNVVSIVNVGEFKFRNPPMHGRIVDQTPRDALYEIDAMLDKYTRHSNVAPFVASRLIQLLTISNPSPRYVEEVSHAFSTGTYTSGGVQFGNGTYGDMGSTIAAVFLDREVRSTILDSDVTHGRAREPILKVMHLLRSMKLSSDEEREVALTYLRHKIGQEVHNAPNVFSFFLSEFSPSGPVYNAGLTSPESQLLDAPNIVGFFNALSSLPLYGLSECEWSEGLGDWNERYVLRDHPEEGRFNCAANGDLESGPSVPFRLRFAPQGWSSGFPSVNASITPATLDSAPYCGCLECTLGNWGTFSSYSSTDNYTCGSRITWVNNNPKLPNGVGACSHIAGLKGEFPDVCGPACDPARCDIDLTAFAAIASSVVDEMNILLTGGRLEAKNQAIIEASYIKEAARRDISPTEAHQRALRKVQQLFSVTPEFHITNNLMQDTAMRVETVESLPESPRPVVGYKAIVYLYFDGALDSYSVLVPHSSCGSTDLATQYKEVRTDVAIPLNQLHQVTDSSGTQPCDVFGLHPSLSHFKELYNDNDAAIIANVGPLVEPISKAEYDSGSKEIPPALFAHNTQKQITQTVFAQDPTAGGVLGRIGDAINAQESDVENEKVEIFDAYSISGTPIALEGAPGVSRVADVLTGYGVSGLVPPATRIETEIRSLNVQVSKSIYGETFSEKVTNTLNRIALLGDTLKKASLFNPSCFDNLNTDIARQFKTVAQVIAARDELAAKRDVFYTSHGGYDTHSDNGPRLTALLLEVDNAVKCFSTELKAQGVWINVTIVTASEFGRTLVSNGQGTDHGWGGNQFVLGGSVNGGKILGEFPSDLTESGPLNIGRGRMIPTTPWEAVWNAISRWFGVSSSQMPNVLPTLSNFPSDQIFSQSDLFK